MLQAGSPLPGDDSLRMKGAGGALPDRFGTPMRGAALEMRRRNDALPAWPGASAIMGIPVAQFLAHPGRRFPLHVVILPTERIDDVRTIDGIRLDGQAFAQLGTLYLEVSMTAVISQPCGRCLAPMALPFTLQETFHVPIPPSADDVDVWRTAVSLMLSAHDPNALCRPDCRGLCPSCGADLNEAPNHACKPDDVERRTLGEYLRQ